MRMNMLFYKSESIDISFFGLDFFKFWFLLWNTQYINMVTGQQEELVNLFKSYCEVEIVL